MGLKVNKDHRDQLQEESSILAGVEQPAPLTRVHNSYMLVELEGHAGTMKEEQPTISVCPDHLQYQSGVQGRSYVAGVEYFYQSMPSLSSVNLHNVPCAVCYVATRSVSVMIPAKTQCPTHWTLEYIGYLGSEYYNRNSRTMYECVDKDPESVPGSAGVTEPRTFFQLVEPYCIGLSCPPYDAEKELTCVVCSR